MNQPRLHRLPDSRVLGYAEFGAPDGRPVLALHGTPGSRLKFTATDQPGRALGLRIIAPDRWGYGASEAPPRPELATYADDIASLMDRLGIEKAGLIGISGGGPYAVAAAAGLGARINALALVSPVGLVAGPGAPPTLGPFHDLCFRMLPRIPGVIGLAFHAFRGGLHLSPTIACRVATIRAPAADRAIFCDSEQSARLLACFREGLRPGTEGPTIDMALFPTLSALPFARIRARARMWLGTVDRNVPRQAAAALAWAVPGCVLERIPGAGHLWIAEHYRTVLEWTAAQPANVAAL